MAVRAQKNCHRGVTAVIKAPKLKVREKLFFVTLSLTSIAVSLFACCSILTVNE